ncbi:MAG: hypothetical protein ACXVQ3_00265 [Gaiellaceae bacterium]
MRRALVVAALLAAPATACGGHRSAAEVPASGAWRANARQVVEQLRVDVAAASIGGTTRADAARALANTSDLYALLVAYSDLGGCRAMVGAAAPPPRVVAAFEPACDRLQRAAALFARAAQRSDPAVLVRATGEAARAQPQLVRAMLAIRQR